MTDGAGETTQQVIATESVTVVGELRPVVAALSCVAATWVTAGSTGLLVYPLRRTLMLLGMAVALIVLSPLLKRSWSFWAGLVLVVCLSLWAVASPLALVNIAGIVVVLAFLALMYKGPRREILWVSCAGVAVFAVYRVALVSIPWVWLLADLLGREIGRLAGLVVHRPLWVGATFAGLDFLVLTGTIGVLWLARSPRPRRTRAFYGALAILGGHLCYLIVLSFSTDLLAFAPRPVWPPYLQQHMQQRWSWQGLVHKAVPWNLPALACVVHLLMLAAVFRWTTWVPRMEGIGGRSRTCVWRLMVLMVACLLPLATGLYPGRLGLEDKSIVFYNQSYVNWLKPAHDSYGRLSGGMCGMLPAYADSFGARTRVSSDLKQEDLQDADVLIVFCPSVTWDDGQLERIRQFVRAGGSLLLLGEHTIHDCNDGNRSNELLRPTGLRVPFDSAMFAVMGWDQSYEAVVHPATAGLADDYRRFGVSIGASLNVHWPASPILVGRWGWTDFGDEGNKQGKLGNWRYDPGEKLGDIVLVAEQRLGRGRVIAFGDTSSLMNTTLVNTHEFMARLLGYLSSDAGQAHTGWRQLAGALIVIVLAGLLTRRVDVWSAGLVALGLAGALVVCERVNHRQGEFLPLGRAQTPSRIAYIDASHVEAYCDSFWRPNDVAGLILTLMRNGYLPFSLPELTPARLASAQLLISIAPSRAFSRDECALVRDFVTRGGTFLITVGYDESSASHSILSEFGFAVGGPGAAPREPDPMGHFKSPYLSAQGKYVHVRFHAAWPVTCDDPNARIIANGRENLPVIIMKPVGAGRVVVVGDTGFALNKNLEKEDGQPFEGQRENADFWRWFVTQLRDEEMWVPPSLHESGPAKTNRLIQEQPLNLQGVQP